MPLVLLRGPGSPPADPALGADTSPPAPRPAPSEPCSAAPAGSCSPGVSAGWLAPPPPDASAAVAPLVPGTHDTSQTPT